VEDEDQDDVFFKTDLRGLDDVLGDEDKLLLLWLVVDPKEEWRRHGRSVSDRIKRHGILVVLRRRCNCCGGELEGTKAVGGFHLRNSCSGTGYLVRGDGALGEGDRRRRGCDRLLGWVALDSGVCCCRLVSGCVRSGVSVIAEIDVSFLCGDGSVCLVGLGFGFVGRSFFLGLSCDGGWGAAGATLTLVPGPGGVADGGISPGVTRGIRGSSNGKDWGDGDRLSRKDCSINS